MSPTFLFLLALPVLQVLAKTHTLLITGQASGGAFAATFNDVTSAVALGQQSLTTGASWIALTPDAKRAYLTFRTGRSDVAAFKVSREGALTPIGSPVTVPVPVYAQFNHQEDLLFTASYPGAAIATVQLDANGGTVGTAEVFGFTATAPIASPQDQSRPHAAIVDSTGTYVIFPDDGLDLLHVYRIVGDGTEFLYDVPSPKRASGPRHGVLSGFPVVLKAPRLHVLNEVDNSIDTWILKYSWSGLSMSLQGSAVSTLSVPAGQNVSTAAELLITPNNKFLISSNRNAVANAEGSIAVFKLNSPNAATAMTRISITPSGGANPRSMTLDQSGKWLAVVNGNSNNVAFFSFSQETGAIGTTPVSVLTGITIPQTVVFVEKYQTPKTYTSILQIILFP